MAAILALVVGMTDTAKTGGNIFEHQQNAGGGFFAVQPPCPMNQFPTFEAVVPVPSTIDPFNQDLLSVFCQVNVTRKGNPVKQAKGTFDSELLVTDPETGLIETFDLGAGKFNTDADGHADLQFDIPTELFADGFESGDISVWSHTRTDFTNKKKADNATVQCVQGSSQE